MSEKPTIVIAAGGTGGHLFPAQSLAEELVRRGHGVILVTDERGKTYAERFPNVTIRMISAATFVDRNAIGRIGAAMRIALGTLGTFFWLGRVKPGAIIGFGGYPSLPAMTAGILRRQKTLIHESNAILGRVNRAIAPFVGVIASAFPDLGGLAKRHRKKVRVTGNPVRDQIKRVAGTAYVPPETHGPIELLVFGGSQGARVFSDAVPAAVSRLPDALKARLRITQQCREEDIANVREVYRVYRVAADLSPFFGDMAERLTRAHLIIARAGASTVTEIAVVGRPSILVPLPSATDDHQTFNAKGLVDAGGAWLLPQSDLTPERLAADLQGILADPQELGRRAAMAKSFVQSDAQAKLADLIEELCGPAEGPAAPA